jgi:hypothetical protein
MKKPLKMLGPLPSSTKTSYMNRDSFAGFPSSKLRVARIEATVLGMDL